MNVDRNGERSLHRADELFALCRLYHIQHELDEFNVRNDMERINADYFVFCAS